MKTHYLNTRFGTLRDADNEQIGRRACVEDIYQKLPLVRVTYQRHKVTCNNCRKRLGLKKKLIQDAGGSE